MLSTSVRLYAVSLLGIVVGLAHLCAPRRLLATARWGYDRVLAVDFRPRTAAPRRVRLVGLSFVAVSLLVVRVARRRHLDSGDSR
jgi:uncharacterized protein YjeT (DUF2065 family)